MRPFSQSADYRTKEDWADHPSGIAKMIEIPPSWTFANQTIPGTIRSSLKERFPPGEVRQNPFSPQPS